jgi:uncharacterized protein YndB with AHSA1/START domain
VKLNEFEMALKKFNRPVEIPGTFSMTLGNVLPIPCSKKIVIGVAAVLLVLAVVVALQPDDFRVVRSISIAAPPETVFARVNDLHSWEGWSPWAKLDPAMKQRYEGPPAGTGAVYSWAGNTKVGEGRMTITESRANEFIRITLEFFKPFSATNTTEFMFNPESSQTVVTWSMAGENNFVSKLMCLFMDMDEMIGDDFEQGLADLKSTVEAAKSKE